jgi:hypothetical protein
MSRLSSKDLKLMIKACETLIAKGIPKSKLDREVVQNLKNAIRRAKKALEDR